MQLAAASVVNALRRRHPAIHAWLADRARLLEAAAPSPTYQSVRYSQARLWSVSMYTDDGHQAILGPELTVIALRVWRKIMGELRLTMAIVQKHGIGQQVTVQGCRFNTGLGIVFVPEDKLRRAIHELDAAVAGQVCLREYHSLVSFLQSLTFVIGMSRSAAYGLFTTLLASGASHPEIQALCRWQTTDSIKIYARLTSAFYSRLLDGAMAARVSTARAQNLALAVPRSACSWR
ncbi:hypothetical protein AB1Y20_008432 [Prymnesium parvum]|uniref:Uncharacterized protein n=1 Tax=Prymnesium parvum TaxID=97485 RepID=A0AB34IRG1_PRYPA